MKNDSKMTVQKLIDLAMGGNMDYAAQMLEEEGEDPTEVYRDLVVICDSLEMAAKKLHAFMGRYICEKGIMASDFLKILGR